jgi:hypothetical protein
MMMISLNIQIVQNIVTNSFINLSENCILLQSLFYRMSGFRRKNNIRFKFHADYTEVALKMETVCSSETLVFT